MINENFRGKAVWSLSLDCQCPECGHDIDLLDDGDMFTDNQMDVLEHDTDRSRNFDVVCPECDHEFVVDFVY